MRHKRISRLFFKRLYLTSRKEDENKKEEIKVGKCWAFLVLGWVLIASLIVIVIITSKKV
jgi:hypothetical protein